MNQCATLVIEVDQNIDFNDYTFGISQPNGNIPYFWGGELSVVGGVSRWIFQGLVSGDYKWYVKNLSGVIIMTGTKTVDCSLSDVESAVQSAINSANSATASENSAILASQKAGEASQSAINSANSATASENSAILASQKADEASQSAINSANSATASENSAILVSQKADEISNAFLSIHTRIAKYTAENQLPLTGDARTVYFLNVAGVKYLKYWNGTAYVNASTKADLPKCVSSVQRDYYATFADISTNNYGNRVAEIQVIEDVNNSNGTGAYYFDGITLNELLLL